MKNKKTTHWVDLTPRATQMIKDLHSTGLHGDTERKVIENLVYGKLRELAQKGEC